MNEKSAAAIAGKRSVPLGGRLWLLSPLTSAGWAELNHHLARLAKAKRKSALESLTECYEKLPPIMQQQALQFAVQSCGDKEPTAAQIIAMVNTLDGIRYNFWLAARTDHPDLTIDAVKELVTEDNQWQVAGELLDLNNMTPVDPFVNGSNG